MKVTLSRKWRGVLTGLALAGTCLVGQAGQAQDRGGGGYAIGEDRATEAPSDRAPAEEGPVRLARFSFVEGSVTWRPDDASEWSTATINLPLRQGAQITVTAGGRAEVQFDDGSLLRLGSNAVATLQTLYSDADGEFTEIKLTDGLATLRLKHDHSVFQIDTPLVSINSVGPARLRVGASDGVDVGVKVGAATVQGERGKASLKAGDYLDLANADAPFAVRALPRDDSWEQWNDERDAALAAADTDNREHQLAPDIALVAGDLDAYGDWSREPQHGWVWCPRNTAADWRPYQAGCWTWVNPFGWTWVSSEAWGWAPYHYGAWTQLGRRWAWVPGPARQCWSPAVVHFTECDNRIAWCPLAPSEVHYSAGFTFGDRGRNWPAHFSICQAAVYYPTAGGYCAPTVFNTTYVNHFSSGAHANGRFGELSVSDRFQSSTERFAANNNDYRMAPFVPLNARTGYGVTAVNAAEFGGRGRFESVGTAGTDLFLRGRTVTAPSAGRAPSEGPAAIKPTVQSLTPARIYLADRRDPGSSADRPVYHALQQPGIVRPEPPLQTRVRTARKAIGADGQAGPSNGPTRRGGYPPHGSGQPVGMGHETNGGGNPPSIRTGLPDNGPVGELQRSGRSRAAESGGSGLPAVRNHTPAGTAGTGAAVSDPNRRPDYDAMRRRMPQAPDDNRRDTAPFSFRMGRGQAIPNTTEPRRDPAPAAPPRRDYTPAPPTRTPEPRRDPAPQQPIRREEPRREVPQVLVRRDPAPAPERRTVPVDPPRREREQPRRDDKPADSSKTPGSGRSR